jgi:TolB-like protein/Flp pilus assembly protein TadD
VVPTESDDNLRLEIGHVLFIDMVGYSKLLIEEQKERLGELTSIVLATAQVRASTDEQLVRLPTGDGMALVFRHSAEEPARCALEIAEALRKHPELPVRMGIHSGPVSGVVDVNQRANLAGAGINIAQRAMDCGDAGHILLSKHVAEDLSEYDRGRPFLHELGTCEVKHGVRIDIINLYSNEVGNAELAKKFQLLKRRRTQRRLAACIALIGALAIVWVGRDRWARRDGGPSLPSLPAFAKSIAVLPFENRSEEKQNEYFADGVQDEILTDLAKIADLKVISRTSVMQYKSAVARNLREIAQQLGVANVLEGSVQRLGNHVRVNAQLIDARTDTHLWAQTYDRDLADVFAIQSEIAKAIADQLQAKLSPSEKNAIDQKPTTDLAAFDLYTRAKSLFLGAGFSTTASADVSKGIELLDEAVKLDPSFFDAYCQLAEENARLYAVGGDEHGPARLALAEAALQSATRLRPDAGQTHLARAQFLYYGRDEYAGALAELERARKTLPNDARIFELTGYVLRRRGQFQEGLRHLQRAAELDPNNANILSSIAISYEISAQYADAIAALDRALHITPDDVATRANRGLYYVCWKADTRPLHDTVDATLAQKPAAITDLADLWFNCALVERDHAAAERALVALGDNYCWNEGGIALSRSFGQGMLARMIKNEPQARAAFEAARTEQEKSVQARPDRGGLLCVLAMIDAALGRNELALEEGRRAIELTPVDKDMLRGSRVLQYFAITAAWAGDKELALQQLETGLRAPEASLMLSYGALKLHPFWDPLRGDPRFEKIVQSLAPKDN